MGPHYDNRDRSIDCDRTTLFFIQRRKERSKDKKTHYNKLNGKLFKLAHYLNIVFNEENSVPVWRKEIEIISPSKINLNYIIENHLKKDKPDLLQSIPKYIRDIETHAEATEKFRKGLRQSIEKIIKDNGIELSQEPSFGFYYDDDYISILNLQLESIIKCIKTGSSLSKLQENQRFGFQITEDGYLLINNLLVGRGDEITVEHIKDLIKNIPFDKLILNDLKSLCKNVSDIEKKSKTIQTELNTIIQKIEDGQYKTSVKCCPKRFFIF